MPSAKDVAQGAAAGSALGPLGTLGGAVIGGLFGRSGQNSANEANLQIARENRRFQERMSNTAYQRSAKDLEAAGLNRILALGQPATTPAGNIATMQNKNAKLAEGISSGISQALTAKLMNANINNVNARTELTKAQRRALGPGAELGEGVETVLDKVKGRITGPKIEYKGMADQLKRDFTSAKDYISGVAESVQLNPFKARKLLIATVRKMDVGPFKTDAEAYRWAQQNPEKIKAYIQRQKQ